jgi:hypothetical protein
MINEVEEGPALRMPHTWGLILCSYHFEILMLSSLSFCLVNEILLLLAGSGEYQIQMNALQHLEMCKVAAIPDSNDQSHDSFKGDLGRESSHLHPNTKYIPLWYLQTSGDSLTTAFWGGKVWEKENDSLS